MRPIPRSGSIIAARLPLAVIGTMACRPSFAWQLLAHRAATLHDLPVDSFKFEMNRLVPQPDPRLPVMRDDWPLSWRYRGSLSQPRDVGAEERHILTPTQLTQVGTMRTQLSPQAAYDVGVGLAAPIRLYVAGAVAFNHGDDAAAASFFHQALSASDGRATYPQEVWAAYMLGRTLARSGDGASAATAFVRTRSLVAAGAPDPLGLSYASLGEQALLSLKASRLPIRMPSADTGEPVERSPDVSGHGSVSVQPDDAALAALHQAVILYGQQAAYNDYGGIDSLQIVAESLLYGSPVLDAWWPTVARDRLLRHLLVIYALSDADSKPGVRSYGTCFLANLDPVPVAADVLDRLAPLFNGAIRPGDDDGDTGRLAALAYLRGRYDLARRIAAGAPGPLAAWIRAKLSLQRPDLAASARAYDDALQALADDPNAMDADTASALRAEPAVVAVARGDFPGALAILYPEASTYWRDVAYVAERLLTTDELKRFVDAHVLAVPLRAGDDPERTPIEIWYRSFDPARALRDLLARRLVRNGRYAEAAATFTAVNLRDLATSYGSPLQRSHGAFWRVDRANAAWKAAVTARLYGMQLTGTELPPDAHVLAGLVDYDQHPEGAYITPLETRRFAASARSPDLRFHYRYVAVDHAILAASLLPQRSQAYEAVLCGASHWMFQSNEDGRANALYRQYVAHGAMGPFAAGFGGYACPSPDFAAAARLRWTLPLRHALGPVRRHQRPVAFVATVGAGLALALVAAVGRARRRQAGA